MQIPMGVSNSQSAHGCLVISNSCGVQLKSKNLSVRAAHARVDAAATCEQQLQQQLASCCMWFTQSDVAAILSPHVPQNPESNTWTNTWHLHWSSELVTNRMGKLLQIPFGQLRSFRHTLHTQQDWRGLPGTWWLWDAPNNVLNL